MSELRVSTCQCFNMLGSQHVGASTCQGFYMSGLQHVRALAVWNSEVQRFKFYKSSLARFMILTVYFSIVHFARTFPEEFSLASFPPASTSAAIRSSEIIFMKTLLTHRFMFLITVWQKIKTSKETERWKADAEVRSSTKLVSRSHFHLHLCVDACTIV